ncbi:xanthine dehydrogenase family protein molybdopterin-binding subunit [candidate division KSB1 bacterium]|nr:xanthine dehydrogenase family protein molybdopterin-binding subunit [candidate division KSB1 bacterium]
MKKDDYLFEPDLDEILPEYKLDRRDFLKHLGGGIIIFITAGVPAAEAQRRGSEYPEDLNAYLKVGEDGRVTCYTGKIEMGQGIFTSLAQMLAEELDVPLKSVDMVMGDTDLCPWDSGTVGSRSTKYFGPPLREAGAKARAILFQLAAIRLKTDKNKLVVKDGIISVKDNPDINVSYAQLTKGKRIERQVGGNVNIKHYSQHTISGTPAFRTDALQKVTGEAKYTGDIRLPGMLYAKVLRPPAHNAKLVSVDTSPAKKIEGIIIVEEKDLVAVLHEKPDVAERALTTIKAEFDNPEQTINNKTIFTHLEKSATSQRIVTENGDIKSGQNNSAQSIEAAYYNHYVAHSPMETHTVLVDIGKDKVRVWVSSQTPFRIQEEVAEILGIPVEKVRVMQIFLGGGFGGKKSGLYIEEAARLAKITGRPVQIALTRKEEFFYNTFRPAAVVKAKTGLNKNGLITLWDFEHLFSGTRSTEPIYNIPHYIVKYKSTGRNEPDAHPFGTGAWRGPGSNTNVFAMESHTDVMAQAAGMDPLSFRLKNLSDERMKRVLTAAADHFGNTFVKSPSGKGYGIACTNYLNTYVVSMAEVDVDKNTGHVQVKRIVCAQDMGEIINPQGAKLQIEGAVTMGLGYCLTEEIKFNGGQIIDENFDTYEITRFSWVPKIEPVLIDNPELPPQGCGEPSITTMGAVIANAVYDAIGVRLYTLPMTPERIKEAVNKG